MSERHQSIEPARRQPTDEEARELHAALKDLMDPSLRITWRVYTVETKKQMFGLISLAFSRALKLTPIWTSFFWGRVIPKEGPGWIIRAFAFDPDGKEVLIEPLPEVLNMECVKLWARSEEFNPLIQATLGFKYLSPFRSVQFPEL